MAWRPDIKGWVEAARIDLSGAKFGLILHHLAKDHGEAVKLEFDQRVKDRRLALLQEIATLDEASDQVRRHWLYAIRRRHHQKIEDQE